LKHTHCHGLHFLVELWSNRKQKNIHDASQSAWQASQLLQSSRLFVFGGNACWQQLAPTQDGCDPSDLDM